MIPKVIHYIWLGYGKKSNLSNICINSWYEKMDDYRIIEWNESNLDIDKIAEENKFFRECKKRKLWAFMADYLRLKILYEHGGIYFDTDIQIIKDLEDLLSNNIILGYEYDGRHNYKIGTGVIACEKHNPIIKKCLDFYDNEIWNCKEFIIPDIIEKVLKHENNIFIYEPEYFAPYCFSDTFKRDIISNNTYTIHWYDGSWVDKLEVRTFLRVKSIKNPIIKSVAIVRQVCGYAYKKFKR